MANDVESYKNTADGANVVERELYAADGVLHTQEVGASSMPERSSGEAQNISASDLEASQSDAGAVDDGQEESATSAQSNAGDAYADEEVASFLTPSHEVVYHLSEFDGPLDLLYTLIKSAKIDIEDIFISDITGQYVDIVKNTPTEELDFEYAGEFITMAAELVYLKSVRTLPKTEEPLSEDDPEYERQLLINKIKEYALLREKSEQLKELETTNRFYRSPQYTDKDYRVALVNFSLDKLMKAFAQVLVKADVKSREDIPKKVMRERFSVHDKMLEIVDRIERDVQLEFTQLFEEDYDKSDIVTTFLAVLELLKYGRLTATQEEAFGPIIVYKVEGANEAPLEFGEDSDGEY